MKTTIRYDEIARIWNVHIFDKKGCVAEFVLSVDSKGTKCERGTMYQYCGEIYDERESVEVMDALCDAIEENLTKNFILIKK